METLAHGLPALLIARLPLEEDQLGDFRNVCRIENVFGNPGQ